MTNFESLYKRTFDVIISSLILVVLSPILISLMILIVVTSPGPAIFRQKRLGKNGNPFTFFKLRTMFVDAQDIRIEDGSSISSLTDPRVTRIGQFLRVSSLDELPQLINVLRGEMSLVGPRPDQLDQLQYYRGEEFKKLDVKPGMTGLAQISGRNDISWEERKKLDITYVENQSLGLDLRILIRTIPYVLLRKGIFSEDQCNENE